MMLSTKIKAPAERLHLKKKTRHDWRWLENCKDAKQVREFRHLTDHSR